MRIKSDRIRTSVSAMLRLLLFTVAFVVVYQLLALVAALAGADDPVTVGTTITLAAAVAGGVLMYRLAERKPAATLGFALTRAAAPELVRGGVIGVAGLVGACAIMVLIGALRYQPDGGTFGQWLSGMLTMLIVLLIAAAAEEALFRGYPFQKLIEAFGPLLATLGASVAFAAAHAGNPSVNAFALANIFAAGVMLSVAYLRTRSLWFATGVHVGWNWSMAALLDLPVSGLELFDAPFYEPVVHGPAWLSGGAFGPEAGLAGLIGLLLALAGVFWTTRRVSDSDR